MTCDSEWQLRNGCSVKRLMNTQRCVLLCRGNGRIVLWRLQYLLQLQPPLLLLLRDCSKSILRRVGREQSMKEAMLTMLLLLLMVAMLLMVLLLLLSMVLVMSTLMVLLLMLLRMALHRSLLMVCVMLLLLVVTAMSATIQGVKVTSWH